MALRTSRSCGQLSRGHIATLVLGRGHLGFGFVLKALFRVWECLPISCSAPRATNCALHSGFLGCLGDWRRPQSHGYVLLWSLRPSRCCRSTDWRTSIRRLSLLSFLLFLFPLIFSSPFLLLLLVILVARGFSQL